MYHYRKESRIMFFFSSRRRHTRYWRDWNSDVCSSDLPEVAPPQVSVTAIYTGANAETVETAVTTPLEQAINGVEGMLYMTSSSTNSGVCQINVVFDITRNQDLAAVEVQNRVNQALGRMPAEVRQTGIIVQKQATNFVMGAGVYSESGQYDSLFLSNYLDVYVKDALKRVAGVSDIMIFGERKYSMRLWRSEEHTSELQSRQYLVCRLLLEKKKKT